MLNAKQKGFSFIEVLVALTIAVILLPSLIAVFTGFTKQYQASVNNARLNQTLQAALSLMTSDIRRAGFWKNAYTDLGQDSNHNPFMASNININNTGNCILFTYDKLGLGSLPSIGTGTDDERYGFRLMNNAIQARPSGAAYDCNATASAWTNITDPNVITITQLSFNQSTSTVNISTASGSPTLTVRTVTISVTGRSTSNSTVTKTLTQQVRVQNDLYSP